MKSVNIHYVEPVDGCGDFFVDFRKVDCIHVRYVTDPNLGVPILQSLYWRYGTADFQSLHSMAKRRDGFWAGTGIGWTFENDGIAHSMLAAVVKKHPTWPVIGDPAKPYKSLEGTHISRITLNDGFDACLTPLPLLLLPEAADTMAKDVKNSYEISLDGKNKEKVGLFTGTPQEIDKLITFLQENGAVCNDSLASKLHLTYNPAQKVKVKVQGWSVQISLDLLNIAHYPAMQELIEGETGNLGTIYSTRKLWPDLKEKLQKAGLEWEGDDPAAEISVPTAFDSSRVAGWNAAAPNGHLMHAYQKTGAQFCASRGMRALIGDEMGVGKTAQAIAAAQAVAAPRILVICPANARYVWDREIQGWGGQGTIQHITEQAGRMDVNARWHILTYDTITTRAQAWSLNDENEEKAFIAALPKFDLKKYPKPKEGYPRKLSIETATDKTPAFADPARVKSWEKMMRRVRGELLEQFVSSGNLLVILDEAHRAKNKLAKRTKAIQKLAQCADKQVLMLTGTPLRNNEHEAAVLLSILDAEAASVLNEHYSLEDVKDFLKCLMIRRTKAEVLPELPDKTRQRIDISELDAESMRMYDEALDYAKETYVKTIEKGKSEAQARQSMQGGIERARNALGSAKVLGGEVAELVLDVVENKGCCVVFCAHHDASHKLKDQLEKQNLRVEILNGETPQKKRKVLEEDFQAGNLDVLIGGINAAGEAITLTRSDTVVFVELDWVPAALWQAEDRIHRVGQRQNCHIIHLVAKMPRDNLDQWMIEALGSKVHRIGTVLGEDTANLIQGSEVNSAEGEKIKAQIQKRLADLIGVVNTSNTPQQQTPSVLPELFFQDQSQPSAEFNVPQFQESNTESEVLEVQEKSNEEQALIVEIEPEQDCIATPELPVELPAPVQTLPVLEHKQEQVEPKTVEAKSVAQPKRQRGRPKIYVDQAPPTATQRSKNSIQGLAAAGGKRIMLRLSPQANQALKQIMAATGYTQDTAAINRIIISASEKLLNAST